MIMIYTIGRKIKIGSGGMLFGVFFLLLQDVTWAETVHREHVVSIEANAAIWVDEGDIYVAWNGWRHVMHRRAVTPTAYSWRSGEVMPDVPWESLVFTFFRAGTSIQHNSTYTSVTIPGWDRALRVTVPTIGIPTGGLRYFGAFRSWEPRLALHSVEFGNTTYSTPDLPGTLELLQPYSDDGKPGFVLRGPTGIKVSQVIPSVTDPLKLRFRFDPTEIFRPGRFCEDVVFVPIGTENVNGLSFLQPVTGYSWEPITEENGIVELTNQAAVDEALRSVGTSNDGVFFTMDKVGMVHVNVFVRDAHSLSSEFPLDNTSATFRQLLVITTNDSPRLTLLYSDGARDLAGDAVETGDVYNPVAMVLPCGGVEGWTRFAPDVNVNIEHIPGNYAIEMTRNNEFWARLQRPDHGFVQYSNDREGTGSVFLSAVLTSTNDSTLWLSRMATTHYKLDTSAPEVSATYHGGFTFTDNSSDDLSGIASEHYPTEIAFTTPSDSSVAPTDGWEELANHSMQTTGRYDVWVRATDKAANRTETKVFSDLFVGGEVNITKNTEEGAVLHMWNCSNVERIEIRNGCDDIYCSVGALPELLEMTDVTYQLTITNDTLINDTLLSDPLIYDILLKDNALGSSAVGTFEDFLPRGVVLVEGLSAVASGEATVSVDSELMTQGSYAGRYRVWGSYSNLAMGEQIYVTIPATTPVFEEASQEIPDVDNLIINQASTNWTIGESTGAIQGSNVSNFATHKVLITPGVDTWFIKTGSDSSGNSGTGLAGAQFALYRWAGEAEPTHAARSHMVDVSVVVDDTLEEGDWVRVKYGGEEIGELTDLFVSSTSPLGEVDLGRLLKGTYTLIETRAPEGYDLPIGQWILTVDPEKMDTGTDDWKIEFVGKSNSMMPPGVLRIMGEQGPTYQLMNIRPFSIGMSGLAGTKGLLLIGFSLMAVAGNIYLVYGYKQRRKMKEAWK